MSTRKAAWAVLARLRQVKVSTWGLCAAAAAMLAGGAQWLPVPWLAVITWGAEALAAWGFFELPGLLTVGGAVALLGFSVAKGRELRRRRKVDLAHTQMQPMRRWVVGLATVVIAAAIAAAGWWLLGLAATAKDPVPARIEAIRTALTLGAGLVAIVVLWLNGRKQWLAERTQRHTELDSTEQRVTQLYTVAAEQLASDKAPVRMAGMYAMERLGQNNPDHRQTIVNVLCYYLRVPDTAADEWPIGRNSKENGHADSSQDKDGAQPVLLDLAPALATAAGLTLDSAGQQRQEHQVRLATQRLLARHLRPARDKSGAPTNHDFWPGMVLDLSGACLHEWDLEGCEVESANFMEVTFNEHAIFTNVTFKSEVMFGDAIFESVADFDGATFGGNAQFFGVRFRSVARFSKAVFEDGAAFDGSTFGPYSPSGCRVSSSGARFKKATFRGVTTFTDMRFNTHADFERAIVDGEVHLNSATTPWCQGEDHVKSVWQLCPKCGGAGAVKDRHCGTCHALGWVPVIPCPDCEEAESGGGCETCSGFGTVLVGTASEVPG